MSLTTPEPPQGGLQLLSEALRDLQVVRSATQPMTWLAAGGTSDLDATTPHQVFNLGLDDVAGGDLARAQVTGWRYLVMRGEQPLAAGELDAPAGGGELAFSHLNEGPFVIETVRAIALAEKLPEVAEADYELRLLRVPALYLMAVWLHGAARDLLIPMPPTDGALVPNRTYTAEEFFAALSPVARARAEFDDSPEA